jgi:RNA polymerase sigma-70 factor, ECF subfamily
MSEFGNFVFFVTQSVACASYSMKRFSADGASSENQRSEETRQVLIDIYEKYNTELYRYAYRMLDDGDLAEDCVSETFSRFLRVMRQGGAPVDNVRAYLYRVAHNWITDHYRRQPLPTLSLDSDLHEDPDTNPSFLLTVEQERQRIRGALMKLPEDQRQVIELRFLEDWSHRDVANALGKSEEATRALQHRALITLRRLLAEEVR